MRQQQSRTGRFRVLLRLPAPLDTDARRMRALILQADPGMIEEWKWRGVPVWEHAGIICTGETYKAVVKLTFAKGASLDEIGDVLRHRSLNTTLIYAKLDQQRLAEVALPWFGSAA